jgi:hypothetical protein
MSEIEVHVVEGTVVEKGIVYSSNNSGGSWWLDDEDWQNLENAGWKVRWAKDMDGYADSNGRWLGALATSATRYGLSEDEAIAEWESVTGQDADAEGCDCCGQPHSFYEEY